MKRTTSPQVVCLLVCLLASQQVQCSSSYISDYFLPTAKIALNKLQQSFASAAAQVPASEQGANQTPSSTSALDGKTENSSLASKSETLANPTGVLTNGGEPNKADFITLDTWKAPQLVKKAVPVGPEVEATVTKGDKVEAQTGESLDAVRQTGESVVSSSESVSEDPTTLASVVSAEPAKETASNSELAPTSSSNEEADNENSNKVEGGQSSVAKAKELASGERTEAPNEPQLAPVDEAAIRETESEAVAAVDASIGFGSSDLFGMAAGDSCYDEYGNARFCEPEFENVAFERQLEVSSECGRPASRFCTTYVNEHNDQIRNCHICDAQHPKKRHPAAYLTDINNSNAPTCWVSAPIKLAPPEADGEQPIGRDNVTIQLNLDKKYEITYVSMQFCSLKPDSLAIYKSQDFGETWQPYQFYSSQCSKIYQRSAVASGGERPFEAVCLNSSSGASGASGAQAARIAFSTLEASGAQPAAISGSELGTLERSLAQHDWMSATNLRIVLDRHQTSWIQSSLAQHHQLPTTTTSVGRSANETTRQPNQQQAGANTSSSGQLSTAGPSESSLTSPSDTYNYALADLTVGGRCKCNGHASRCVHADDGRLHCDCRHNTAGRDCERCAPFHFDRPWQRATQQDVNPCQPCQCNGHSRKCRFDAELYQLSGKRSGGVCIACRDNTAGRHCHYCKEGYTRDHSKPMSDKEACKPCDCHPVGSLGRVCNQTTGQCPCKEGVTGLECNRCAAGYQQSSSPSEPCIKLPENDINYEPTIEAADGVGRDEDPSSVSGGGESPGAPQEPSLWVPPYGQAQETGTETGGESKQASASRFNPPNRQRPPAQDLDSPDPQTDEPFPMNQDPDDMQTMIVSQFPGSSQSVRPRSRPHFSSNNQRSRHNFYRQHGSRAQNARPPAEMGLSNNNGNPEEFPMDDSDSGTLDYSPRRGYGNDQAFYYQSNKRTLNRHGSGHQAHTDLGDSSVGDDFVGSLVPSVSYAAPDNSQNDDQANGLNNHIQATGVAIPMRSMWQHNGPNFHQRTKQRVSTHHQQISPQNSYINWRRYDQKQQQQQQALENSLACTNCQSNSKRLRFRQFCQLDYAIKAQVLNMFMAEDWTRFDVEVEDVFKSASNFDTHAFAKHLDSPIRSNKKPSNNFIDDNDLVMQASNSANLLSSANTTSLANKQQQQLVQQQDKMVSGQHQQLKYRLKIDSVHSIWVPTEDVVCHCPKLQLKTSYLLMGLVDANENSATSIQLDRHGVAVEWKSTLQERLIKYQRRYSKGRC